MKKFLLKRAGYFMIMSALTACNGVEITQPKQADIINAVFASGHVITDEEYQVTAKTESYLVKSYVEEGVQVDAGMPLFQLANEVQSQNLFNAEVTYQDALRKADKNSPEQIQLKLQVDQARLQLELDEKNYRRYRNLLASKAVSQLDFEQMKLQYDNSIRNVEAKEKALEDLINSLELDVKNAKSQWIIQQEKNDDYFLFSSIEGKVLKVYKRQGELVRPGETVAVIGGGRKLAKLFVSEEDIHDIKLNQLVILNLNTQKNKTYNGTISKIYPSFDEVEQSFILETVFIEKPDLLYHNTQLQANIIIGEQKNALVIPSEFLSKEDSVMLKNGTQKFVQVGIRNDQWVEIIDGVDQTDVLQKPDLL
ncbi:MAG: HlyD family efflux transporter periplasmic adaptor subunit [Bacteroidota bacterium]